MGTGRQRPAFVCRSLLPFCGHFNVRTKYPTRPTHPLVGDICHACVVHRALAALALSGVLALAGCGAGEVAAPTTTFGPATTAPPSAPESTVPADQGPLELMKQAATTENPDAPVSTVPSVTLVPPLVHYLENDGNGMVAVQAICVGNFLIERDSAGNLADITQAAAYGDSKPTIDVYERMEQQQGQPNVCFEP